MTGLLSVPSLSRPFSVTLFYAGPVRLVLIAHACDYRRITERVAVLQCSIIVVPNEIKQAAPRSSLPCTRTTPAAEYSLAPLRDTAGFSPDDIVLVMLRTLAETYPACGFSWQCLPGFAHRLSCSKALASLLSTHTGNFRSSAHPSEHPMGVY